MGATTSSEEDVTECCTKNEPTTQSPQPKRRRKRRQHYNFDPYHNDPFPDLTEQELADIFSTRNAFGEFAMQLEKPRPLQRNNQPIRGRAVECFRTMCENTDVVLQCGEGMQAIFFFKYRQRSTVEKHFAGFVPYIKGDPTYLGIPCPQSFMNRGMCSARLRPVRSAMTHLLAGRWEQGTHILLEQCTNQNGIPLKRLEPFRLVDLTNNGSKLRPEGYCISTATSISEMAAHHRNLRLIARGVIPVHPGPEQQQEHKQEHKHQQEHKHEQEREQPLAGCEGEEKTEDLDDTQLSQHQGSPLLPNQCVSQEAPCAPCESDRDALATQQNSQQSLECKTQQGDDGRPFDSSSQVSA